MAANKTSAVADQEPVDILFALHPKFDMLDFAGPLQVFTAAQHDFNNEGEEPGYSHNLRDDHES